MTKTNTQKELFNIQLNNLLSDITENDRKAYMTKYDKSPTMLSNYLNKKVSNLDTAAEMLMFFRQRIAKRNKLITAN